MPRSRNNGRTVAVRVVGAQKKVKGGRQRRRKIAAGPMAGCDCTLEYFKSLVDPFEYGNQKLGWGTMVPTATPQGYLRGVVTSGTDGSLTIVALPSVIGAVAVWNTAVATVAATSLLNLPNAAAITANCGEGRVVSMGIRAFPNIALTVAPGAAYSGATVATTFVNLNLLSTSDFITLPTSHLSIGTLGVSSTGRPVDPESFVFTSAAVDAVGYTYPPNTTRSIPFSCPYVSFTGLPSSSTVFYEVVINFEATQAVLHSGTTILADAGADSQEVVGDTWPTPDALMRKIAPYMPHPGRVGEATAALDANFLSSMWSGLKSIVGVVNTGRSVYKAASGLISPAMRMLSGPGVSGQRIGRQFAGYLQ